MKGMRFKKKDGRFKDENCLKTASKPSYYVAIT